VFLDHRADAARLAPRHDGTCAGTLDDD